MKVIDLLNKIANGEEVPKKIKWEDTIYAYSEYDKDYLEFPFSEDEYKGLFDMKDSILTQYLNDEVEVLEEDKEIEDTKYMRHHEGNGKCYIESKGHKYYVPYDLLLLIDNLVKEVNELKKGK